MSLAIRTGSLLALLVLGFLLAFTPELPAQESATPEVAPGTGEVPAKKPPTLKELARIVERLQKENAALRQQIAALESRLGALERPQRPSDLERRMRALEAAGTVDVQRVLGLSRNQTLDSWHRDAHRTSSDLRIHTEREWEDWHQRDHQRRGLMLK